MAQDSVVPPIPAMTALCPKCRTEMIFVTTLPHPRSAQMHKTTFVCYGCNQTRNYTLSSEMAAAYQQSTPPIEGLETVG